MSYNSDFDFGAFVEGVITGIAKIILTIIVLIILAVGYHTYKMSTWSQPEDTKPPCVACTINQRQVNPAP